MDSAVGDILKSLRDNSLERDTLVIFTSDNGAALVSRQHGTITMKNIILIFDFFKITCVNLAGSNGPLLCGKQTTFEGGFRTPTIAWWPGVIQPGQIMHKERPNFY